MKLRHTVLALSVVLPGCVNLLAAVPSEASEPVLGNVARSATVGSVLGPSISTKPSASAKDSQANEIAEADDFEEPDEPGNCLAIHGSMNGSGLTKSTGAMRVEPSCERLLVGSVELSDGDAVVNSQIKFLTETALNNSSGMKDAQAAREHFKTIKSQAAVKTKDTLQILTAYRGFASSKEAGDIILDESLRLNGLPAAELAVQKEIDAANAAVIEGLMQVTMGLGLQEEEKRIDIIVEGFKKLSKLVGEEKAQSSVTSLAAWNKRLKVPASLYTNKYWSPSEQQKNLSVVHKAALERDPHIAKAVKGVHGYNKKSKLTMAASHVIEGGLGLACLVPTAVGPAAQVALTGFEMATGGSEENKLLKQIYLSKRLQSRDALLKQKASLALQNYQMGMLTHNAPLLAFSESLISEMSGEETAKQVLGNLIEDLQEQESSSKKAAIEPSSIAN